MTECMVPKRVVTSMWQYFSFIPNEHRGPNNHNEAICRNCTEKVLARGEPSTLFAHVHHTAKTAKPKGDKTQTISGAFAWTTIPN